MPENADIAYRREVVNSYKDDVRRLSRYLPWLEEKDGSNVSSLYDGDGITAHSVAFPVYDATLLAFIKDAQQTNLLDRNYPYIYTRYQLRTMRDEIRIIGQADITKMDILKGILSHYVCGGMTKSSLWSQAVTGGIFLRIVKKMKENLEFWDRPMDV